MPAQYPAVGSLSWAQPLKAWIEDQVAKAPASPLGFQDASVLGVSPQDTQNAAVAAINTTLINSALQAGDVVLPAGTIWVDDAIRVPSYRRLVGAGIDKTLLKMIDGIDRNIPVLTNALNRYQPRTLPDRYLYIADLSIDGNSANRQYQPYPYETEYGSGLSLAGVEYAVVERVYSHNVAAAHSFDVTSSVYPTQNEYTYPVGPSRWVVLRDCVAGSSGDDAYTTHGSRYLVFDNCQAYNEEPGPEPRNTYSFGFEFDDTSQDCAAINCYAYGFAGGFTAKGHLGALPAIDAVWYNCTADTCGYGFQILWDNSDHPSPTPEMASNCYVLQCKVINARNVNPDPQTYLPAVRVSGFTNVHISDLRLDNCPQSEAVLIISGSTGVYVDGVVAKGSCTDLDAPDKGMINIISGFGDDIHVRNVRRFGTSVHPLVRVTSSSECETLRIENVYGAGTGAASGYGAVHVGTVNSPEWDIRGVHASGYESDIKVLSGSYAGSYRLQLWPREVYGTAAPTTGVWSRGDKCWNRTASASATAGWVCVSSGTPGVWKPLANLGA